MTTISVSNNASAVTNQSVSGPDDIYVVADMSIVPPSPRTTPATGGAYDVVIDLPSASLNPGMRVTVSGSHRSSTRNYIFFAPDGSDQVGNNTAGAQLCPYGASSTNGQCVTLISDGVSNWFIETRYP